MSGRLMSPGGALAPLVHALLPVAVLGLVAYGFSLVVTAGHMEYAFGFTLVVAIFIVVFMRTEVGIYLVILSMLLSPEVGRGQAEMAENRSLVFRAEDFLLMIIAASWFAKTAVNKELGLVVKTALNRPIVAYIGAACAATLLGYLTQSIASGAGMFYVLKYVEYFFVYYMVVNNLTTRTQARRFVIAALVTAAIVSVIGIMQIPSGHRVSAPFEGQSGEPNTMGGYLLLIMAVLAGIGLETAHVRTRVVTIGLAILAFVPFLFTLSRASYVAFIPMCLVLTFLSRRRRTMVVVLGLVLLLSPVLVSVAPAPVTKRIAYTFKPEPRHETTRIGTIALDPSTSARFASFRQALEGWSRRPIFGWGVTGFGFMDAQYARTLVETGIVGLAALLWLLLTVLRMTRDALREAVDGDERGFTLGFLAGTAGLLGHAVGSNTFIIVRIMEPFWMFAAIVAALHFLPRPASPLHGAPARVPAGGRRTVDPGIRGSR